MVVVAVVPGPDAPDAPALRYTFFRTDDTARRMLRSARCPRKDGQVCAQY
jgi:hypothetical protein